MSNNEYKNGIDQNTILYLRGDSFTDLSFNPKVVKNSGCTTTSSEAIRVTHGKKLTLKGDTDFTFNFNDFTVEFWLNVLSLQSYWYPIFISNKGQKDFTFYISNSGDVRIDLNDVFGNFSLIEGASGFKFSNHLNEWVHFAFVGENKDIYVYVNGIKTYKGTRTLGIQMTNMILGYDQYYPNNGINCDYKSFRVSNIARYTENFELPTQPCTSVNITDIEFNNNNISCQVYKGSDNESISKVDVLLNGDVIKSLTENYDNIDIIEGNLSYGNNEIEVRAYYYNDYYVNKKYNYYKDMNLETINPLTNLAVSSDLVTIKNRISEINAINKVINSNLKVLLESKGFDCGDTPRLSKMVEMVKELDNNNSAEVTEYINKINALQLEASTNRGNLATVLTDEGVELTGEETMAELIVKVNELNNVNIPTWVDTKKGISIKASSIPSARTGFGIAYVDGYIYTIGGYNNTAQNNSLPKAIYRYSVNENTWELMNGTSGVFATVQYGGYYNHTSSAVGTVIYSFAGRYYNINNQGTYIGGADDSSIRAYDTLTDTTTGLGNLSVSTATSSGRLISCAYGTDIYCFGGSYTSNGTNYNLNILYNTLTNTCTRKLNMPAHRSHPCVGEVEGLLYCIGGGYGTMHNTNYCYDPLTNSWSEKTTMPGTSVYSNSVTMNKKIYIISEKLSVCYDPINDEWSDMTVLTNERLLPGLATDGERIYAIGGNGPVNTNECFIIR